MLKKLIAAFVAFSMFLVAIPAMAAAGDQPSTWAKAEVDAAISAGLVPGNLQSNYQKAITRGEFAQLLVQTMFANYKNANAGGAYWILEDFMKKVEIITGFTDANQDYIKAAFALGSINGVSETSFAPNNSITRQEAATMLANTIHTQVGFTYYPDISKLGYSDYAQIASWAKPAVQIMKDQDIMGGVGGKFDYSGKYTREQSIATMLRIYNKQRLTHVALRGNIDTRSASDEIFYVVNRDSVKVNFDAGATANNSVLESYAAEWRSYEQTKGQTFDANQAAIIYEFQAVTKSRDVQALLTNTFANKSVKIDYGYMTLSTFNKDSLMEFKFKDIAGYSSLTGGYTYGFPKVTVTPKEIK